MTTRYTLTDLTRTQHAITQAERKIAKVDGMIRQFNVSGLPVHEAQSLRQVMVDGLSKMQKLHGEILTELALPFAPRPGVAASHACH